MKKRLLLFLVICPVFSLLIMTQLISAGQPNGNGCVNDVNCDSRHCGEAESLGVPICCPPGKQCCLSDRDCSYVSTTLGKCSSDFYCLDALKKANGEYCSSNSDCQSSWCKGTWCCESGKNCCKGNSQCASDEVCGSSFYCIKSAATPSPSTPPPIPSTPEPEEEIPSEPVMKSNGQSCYEASECEGSYCVHEICRSTESYCGDGFCDLFSEAGKCNEDCIKCNSQADCEIKKCTNCISGTYVCAESFFVDIKDCVECTGDTNCKLGYKCANEYCVKKTIEETTVGGTCTTDEQCPRDNECKSGICCKENKECCNTDADCAPFEAQRSAEDKAKAMFACIPSLHYCWNKYYSGGGCISNEGCVSGNCKNQICCEQGKECCYKHEECGANAFCNGDYYCEKEYAGVKATCIEDKNCEIGLYCWKSASLTFEGECRLPDEIVVSIEPADDTEAIEIKLLIEKKIYSQVVINCFDGGTFYAHDERANVGPRKNDKDIHLKMTDKDSTAQWDEETNTLTVPYARMYANLGEYNEKLMQQNAIAHELAHYHMSGIAQATGGDSRNAPLWFREGISELCADKYYKYSLFSEYASTDMKDFSTGFTGHKISVADSRESVFMNYLLNPTYNYRETVESNALDKVSWESESDMERSIDAYDHVYYGATYSFMRFFMNKYKDTPGFSSADMMKYIFVMGSKDKFNFYTEMNSTDKYIDEYELKKEWSNSISDPAEIDAELKNAPLKERVSVKFRDIWNYIKSLI